MRYILVDGKPVLEPDLLKWAVWFENAEEERVIAQDKVGPYQISTVFLGLDHNFMHEGDPVLFETMVWGPGEEDSELAQSYTTIELALQGHEKARHRAGRLLKP